MCVKSINSRALFDTVTARHFPDEMICRDEVCSFVLKPPAFSFMPAMPENMPKDELFGQKIIKKSNKQHYLLLTFSAVDIII